MSDDPTQTDIVKGWVKTHLSPLMQELGVNHWHVYVSVETVEQPDDARHTVHMTCHPDADYWLATIQIDPEHNDNEARFLENLTHELLHLHMAALDKFHLQMQRAFYQSEPSDKQSRLQEVLDADFVSAVERSIRSLEGMVMKYREVKAEVTTL